MKENVSSPGRYGFRLLGEAVLLILVLFLAGCTNFWGAPAATPTFGAAETTAATLAPTITISPESGVTPSPAGGMTLTLWLPPEFDPYRSEPAAEALLARLQLFITENPGTRINVRLKAQDGPGGLLEALAAAAPVAPQVMPAVVAMRASDVALAADQGLLVPLDGLSAAVDETDWYAYAHDLAAFEGRAYGLPFSGDAVVMVYRPAQVDIPPQTWQELLLWGRPVLFPAADEQAWLTFLLYQGYGGVLTNDHADPILQAAPLAQVLDIYARGLQQGSFSTNAMQTGSDAEVWQAFLEQRSNVVITWSSNYLKTMPADAMIASLPSLEKRWITLADGWVWCITDPDPARRELSIRLAEHLTASNFMADWSQKAGLLPARPSALAAWPNQTLRAVLGPIAISAQEIPGHAVTQNAGPVLQSAVLQILRQEIDPFPAAQSAVEALSGP